MTRHKLVVASTIVLALLLFGLTPKLVGMNLRDTSVTSLFALIPPEYERQLEISETHFDAGWFGSTAQFDVKYSALGMQAPLSMQLEFDFDHGPVLLTNHGLRLGWAHASITPSLNNPDATEAINQIPFELPELELNLITGFSQTLTVELLVAPTSLRDSDVAINFEGLTARLVAHRDQSAEIYIDMGRFSAGEGANEFSIDSLDLDSRTEQLSDLLAPSSAELTIPAVSATGVAAFLATDINALSRLTGTPGNAGQLNFYQKIDVAEVESDLPLESLSWASEINEISTEIIRSYYDLLASVQGDFAGNSGSPVQADLDQLAQELLLVLVQNSLVFNNYIDASVYEGEHRLEVLLKWLGIPQTSSITELSLEQIIAAVELELHMILDLEAIARSPFAAMIDPYVQQGYITLDNGQVLLDLSLVDDQLIVNGEVTPLGNFSIQQNL